MDKKIALKIVLLDMVINLEGYMEELIIIVQVCGWHKMVGFLKN